MVSVATREGDDQLTAGLRADDGARLQAALDFVRPSYEGKSLVTGQEAMSFARGVVSVLASLRADIDTRIAGLLFELPLLDPTAAALIEPRFGKELADMVTGIRQLMRLHEGSFMQQEQARTKSDAASQLETLRKMMLAMATDMRMVLVRLASRLTTLRFFADSKLENAMTLRYARETFDLYAPLANRLGIWQMKWELEDLSFRFVEPDNYKRIAKMLEERRVEREQFVEQSIVRLKTELTAAGIRAEVYGRPKHI